MKMDRTLEPKEAKLRAAALAAIAELNRLAGPSGSCFDKTVTIYRALEEALRQAIPTPIPDFDAKLALGLLERATFEPLGPETHRKYDLPGAGPGAYAAIVDDFEICLDPNADTGTSEIYFRWMGKPEGEPFVYENDPCWTVSLRIERIDG